MVTTYALMWMHGKTVETMEYPAAGLNMDQVRGIAIKRARKYKKAIYIRPTGAYNSSGYVFVTDGDPYWYSYKTNMAYNLTESGKIDKW